jgi:hypothetical protein
VGHSGRGCKTKHSLKQPTETKNKKNKKGVGRQGAKNREKFRGLVHG